MTTSFILKNQPLVAILRDVKNQRKDIDLDAIEAYRGLMIVTNRLRDAADAFLSGFGASQGKASVLANLSGQAPGSLTPSELAQRQGVTRATVTGLIDGLEREGLVRRARARAGSADRRCVAVSLTPAGARFVAEFLPPYAKRIASAMGALSRAERRALVRLLAKVDEGLATL